MKIIEGVRKRTRATVENTKSHYQKAIDQNPKLEALIPFIGKLFLAGLVFRGIIFLSPNTYFLQEHLAGITAEILNSIGGNYHLQNALIIGENGNYLVTQDCLGWKSVAAFIGLVFATTSNLRKHLDAILLGSLAIIGINILRVLTTIWLSEFGLISFDIIHTFLWRWGMTIIVFFLWFGWLKRHSEDLL